MTAQFGGGTRLLNFGQPRPKVYVGNRILTLPPYGPSAAKNDGFSVAAMSHDARLVAGYSFSGSADPDRPFFPLIWRCG